MSPLEGCTQPQCLLRDEAVGSRFIAELVVRVMAGEGFSAVVSSERIITPTDRCLECVLNVMHDRGPLRTIEKLQKLVAAGRWSRKRSRRFRRRRDHYPPTAPPVKLSFP